MIIEFKIFENITKHEKYQQLKQNKPVLVYRGISDSGVNFYKGGKELPFTYFSLTKEKAQEYGNVNTYIFNKNSQQIKIFPGYKLFEKFGLNSNVENTNVINTLIEEGYSAVLLKGVELIVYDKSLISKI